ncbi:hypothetical protein F8S09_04240 [Deinococcus sp. SDU3-2]|uniref:YD repeat-containing protein n=1 Tax=Deinococcus terrestris TaxID=2651870 RepID=A0A7X1TQK7_9DEIO|nr:hypothetical protein [Deinococcus terrestris]MPY65908.1 hypothetical protein [Deinococcus terrestris]
MKRLLLSLLCLAPLAVAQPARLPPIPSLPAARTVTVGDLRTCTVGDVRLTVDRAGWVRFLTHGHRYPDNTLVVRQSYDRAGRLTGVRVDFSGFAGRLLDVRSVFDARGRLIRETGYRRAGVTTPLRSFIRPLPRDARC